MTQFAPDKWNRGIPDSEYSERNSQDVEKVLTWEERMHKRQRDIQAGRLEPAEPTSMQDGGKI